MNGLLNLVNIVASPDASSLPNIVSPATIGQDLYGQFVFQETEHTKSTARSLNFTVTGVRGGDMPWTFSIFDQNGTFLASTFGSTSTTVNLANRRQNLLSFRFHPGGPTQGLDDVQFEQGVVPEPGTLVLLGSGLAAAGWSRVRKARQERRGR